MSPIRFRAFDKEHGEMLSHENLDHSDTEGLIMWGQIFAGKEPDIVLMQSTGLFDKNGKEIFEGDIIIKDNPNRPSTDHELRPSRVKWDSQGCGWNLRNPKFHKNPWTYEVIGNVHEHPELLAPTSPSDK